MKRGLLLWLLVTVSVVGAYAQTKLITGKVTDAKDGSGLPGVSIGIKGSGKGALTANDGSYRLEISETGHPVLVFSFIGYTAQEVAVGAESTIDVALGVNKKDLGEVVVTALGIRREKRTLGYATQEVKGEDIVQSKEASFLNGLQGKVAGVQISATSGAPGAGTKVIIRGGASLRGNNQPLFVLDGVPISNDQLRAGDDDPLYVGGTTPNRGIDIDPNIIESVNILRGASATALYGSRAAGGAIIITTKNGAGRRSKGLNVIVGSSINIDKAILPEFQQNWAQGDGGKYYDGLNAKTPLSWGPRMDTFNVNGQPLPKYDPRKMFFKTGTTWDNSVSLSGMTDKSSYLLSYTSLRQEGVTRNADYYRNALYANFSSHLTEKLVVNTSLNYIDSRNDRLLEGNGGAGTTTYLSTLYSAPISYNLLPYTNPDGSQRMYKDNKNSPFWIADRTGLRLNVHRFIPTVSLVYTPLNWLTLTEQLGADVYTDNRTFHEAKGSLGTAYPNGRVFDEVINNTQINHDFYATAHKTWNKFDLTVMAGNNIISEHYTDLLTKGIGLSVDNLYDIANSETITTTENYYDRRRVSIYGQAVLEYNKMFYVTVTGRNDWSSALRAGHNSYFYPSVTGAFVFSELSALKSSKTLSFGKLRVAYTAVGNDAAPYQTDTKFYKTKIQDGFGLQIIPPVNGASAFSSRNILGNPNLEPERLKEFEAGLETKWFDNRIGLEASWYSKVSTNLIYETSVSAGSGYTTAIVNAGKLTNKGIELTLTATPVRAKDFNWNLMLNYSRNRSEIVRLSPGVTAIQIGGYTAPGIFLEAGQPYGTIKGSRWKRNADGQQLVTDNGYPILDQGTAFNIGNIQPDWLGGFTNTFSYKGIDLSATLDARIGGQLVNFDEYYSVYYGTSNITANRDGSTIIKGVRASDGKENTTAIKTNQQYYQGMWVYANENLIQDASFIKLRNVTLAYHLMPKLLKRTPFRAAMVSIAGRNLWIHHDKSFTGSDPELGTYGVGSNAGGFYHYVTPSTRSFNATMKFTF
ncbi:SusC/RagA family TonB-linked outer membrane protein [Chitinophaga sp. Ak27]|uniref:SusC/RagA family TonB-linked outer membrane protein n=1 Tax=Chitinophaga sp. Ak27 TaxID=2726116 RepID=UPI00145DE432|nr:SusC/RagA family TonB-linked outer membrane protein [Chitinophaga sp. Ak27]NLU93902.1 SusC/RagA family TonB-linked outer membrane protein [Chitinophaga sp. Ak27]